jgi:hypothetical protein
MSAGREREMGVRKGMELVVCQLGLALTSNGFE